MAVIGFPFQSRAEEFIGRKITEFVYRGFDRKICGYTGTKVPPQYLVTVTWRYKEASGEEKEKGVCLILQEDINLGVESFWKGFVNPYSLTGETLNVAFQALSGGRISTYHKIATRRIWVGTTPIKISLSLKAVANEDAEREVVMPVKLLSSLALPREAIVGFVAPPGPTPFSVTESAKTVGLGGVLGGVSEWLEKRGIRAETIDISIGKFLVFPNVVVKNVDAKFHSKFTPEGYPIAADINIVFESYQIMTREEFGQVFKSGKSEEK